jgi:hypothetical protein
MPAPEKRSCETCKHWRPYEGLLREAYAKCRSPKKPSKIEFAETCRGIPDLCGPTGRWWERKPPAFEVVEDEPPALDWDEGDREDEI